MFIELSQRCAEIEFFSWSCIQFFLYFLDKFVVNILEISVFWQIKPYELIPILDASFLP